MLRRHLHTSRHSVTCELHSTYLMQLILHLPVIALLIVNHVKPSSCSSSSSSSPAARKSLFASSSQQLASSSELDASSAISLNNLDSSEDTGEVMSPFNSPRAPVSSSPSKSKCLIAQNVDTLCEMTSSERFVYSNLFYLSFCSMYSLKLVTQISWLNSPVDECRAILNSLLQNDAQANDAFVQFTQLLSRYNCQSGYSVRWNCSHCSRVYREWICSNLLTLYSLTDGNVRKPCEDFCERVQARCPYFHPASGDQYAGEPVFLCADDYIPLLTSQISGQSECYSLSDLQIGVDIDSDAEETVSCSRERNTSRIYSSVDGEEDESSGAHKCRSNMQNGETIKQCQSIMQESDFAAGLFSSRTSSSSSSSSSSGEEEKYTLN